jgi:hypothetical protein
MMGAMYVQAVVDSLNERFPDLPVFNASKLFSPKYYPSDEEIRITMSEQWLERLIVKFGLTVVESDASRAELLEFVETLRHECENKSLYEAWQFCGAINEWYTNWPHLMKIWQKILVIPSSIAICERGFSKQNAIKSHLRTSLKLDTLDALMRVSLCGIELKNVDWRT